MSTATRYYNYATTMQAAYGELVSDETLLTALEDVERANFTSTQARMFKRNFSLVLGGYIPNQPSGFSATLLRETSGQAVIAIRGSDETLSDIIYSDIQQIGSLGIAVDQAV